MTISMAAKVASAGVMLGVFGIYEISEKVKKSRKEKEIKRIKELCERNSGKAYMAENNGITYEIR